VSERLSLPEVFSAREIARAAGVGEAEVRALIDAGAIRTIPTGGRTPLVAHAEALRAARLLSAGLLAAPVTAAADPGTLFRNEPGAAHAARAPFAISGAAHACLVGALVVATTFGLGSTAQTTTAPAPAAEPLQLVYLALPGPGGGGGGGGLRRPVPPPRAERKGQRAISSPLPDRTPKPQPAERPAEPDPPPPEPLPEVVAAVATAPADERDRAGVLEDTAAGDDSRGPGEGGGTGTGRGTGIGEGDGSGLGEGSGGGTGGGPYRPGSGIDPPALLREVRPDYTEEARQRGVEGDVLMEIVVRRDGTVGEVRVLQGLGHGLESRAVQAVRQWRFEPARRHGQPVDVLVEVAMEFKIR
jgi:protein TonB